ncbi:hypothetical protein [Methylobacterium persicinum]|uniref:Uncharacterized protein n=1 Tax=Methylobacterium persicinum TaxID=374426 RepID=A0ABU0HSZ7_9HYPH|nr:hypothetical protein [Methylobacterium persicinum]MDQ0445457.1 hypothetical protein [Methylobacterium persicinum]
MNVIQWLLAKISQILLASKNKQRMDKMIRQKESGDYVGAASEKARNFDEDYRSATYMLKQRMNKKFPDNYHARLSSGDNSPYDHGEDRALAVDAASIAIATALRNGASVRQAAEAGAVSVGI